MTWVEAADRDGLMTITIQTVHASRVSALGAPTTLKQAIICLPKDKLCRSRRSVFWKLACSRRPEKLVGRDRLRSQVIDCTGPGSEAGTSPFPATDVWWTLTDSSGSVAVMQVLNSAQ